MPPNPRVPRLVKPLSETGHFSGWEITMVKERCSAEQLADMIAQKINVTGVDRVARAQESDCSAGSALPSMRARIALNEGSENP